MKRSATVAILASTLAALVSCESPPPPPVHVHHYRTTTPRTVKKTVSVDRSNTPEGFQAVKPPASYSY